MQVADAETTMFVHLPVMLAQDCHCTIFILVSVHCDAPLYYVLMSILRVMVGDLAYISANTVYTYLLQVT
ncbi:hypothetical protein MKW92_040447, partial [Papaver armeniacum]